MNRFVVFLLFICLLAANPAFAAKRASVPQQPAPQQAQMPAVMPPAPLRDRIAAVVNDNVISTADIEERLKLALISSGLPDRPEVIQQLLPQILRTLIDEQLQQQEAKRLDITISKDEIDKALEKVQQDNRIPVDMRTFVSSRGVSPEALEQQMRAAIAWNKVAQRELRPHIDVGDDEIDAVIERIRANSGKEEFLVSEIFLAVDSPKDEDQVSKVASNLVQQLKSGANFSAVAHQFSQGTGAASGGDIGWIQEGQLSPELNRALVAMQAGEVAGPIRSASGFHILGLRQKRLIALGGAPTEAPTEISFNLQQAFRPFDDTGSRDAVMAEAGKVRADIGDCKNLAGQLAQKFPAWHWQSLGDVKPDKMPAWLADKVKSTPVGKGSEAMVTDKGALIIFVCERHVPEGKVDREAIYNSIGTEKLELQARRLMRDLRRAAYVDIRLGNGA